MTDIIHPVGDHADCLDLSVLKSPDARDILRIIYRRVIAGEANYGPLDVVSDPRDFQQERLEEQVDAPVYQAMDVLRSIKRRDEARQRIRERLAEMADERTMTLTETE